MVFASRRVAAVDQYVFPAGVRQRVSAARPDEKAALPVIFRVDQEAGVPDARRYLADCGGRGQCFDVPGAVCLQHVGGPGRATRGDFKGSPGPLGMGGDIGGGL